MFECAWKFCHLFGQKTMKHSTKNDVKKNFSNEALVFSKIFTHLLLDSSSAMFVTNIEEENQKKIVRRTSCKVKSKQRKEVIICLFQHWYDTATALILCKTYAGIKSTEQNQTERTENNIVLEKIDIIYL